MSIEAAKPIAGIGDMVTYLDHHNRPQRGRVQYIEAKWFHSNHPRGRTPSITYQVEHPTYHRKRCYTARINV